MGSDPIWAWFIALLTDAMAENWARHLSTWEEDGSREMAASPQFGGGGGGDKLFSPIHSARSLTSSFLWRTEAIYIGQKDTSASPCFFLKSDLGRKSNCKVWISGMRKRWMRSYSILQDFQESWRSYFSNNSVIGLWAALSPSLDV